jgi:AcrR family transcriptional regulator
MTFHFHSDRLHQTSMPDITAEAGLSVGVSYRYFASEEELILEIAGAAFRLIFDPVERLADQTADLTVADLAAAAVDPVSGDVTVDRAGAVVRRRRAAALRGPVLGRAAAARGTAAAGHACFEQVHQRIAEALLNGQRAGRGPAKLDPDRTAWVVTALRHGFVLQRTAFGLDDPAGFADDVRAVLRGAGVFPGGAS